MRSIYQLFEVIRSREALNKEPWRAENRRYIIIITYARSRHMSITCLRHGQAQK